MGKRNPHRVPRTHRKLTSETHRPPPAGSTPHAPGRGSDAPLAHWLVYAPNPESGRELKYAWARDGLAWAEIMALLTERGYRYGRPFLNLPPDRDELDRYRKTMENPPLLPTSVDFLRAGDLAVVVMRLPKEDWEHPSKVCTVPGFTELEARLFQLIEPFVAESRRDFIRLQPEVARRLDPDRIDRAATTFKVSKPAPVYKTFSAVGRRRREARGDERGKTAVYLLYLERVAELNGAGLLNLWGQSANETFAWARLVRTKFGHLLDRSNFTVAELTIGETPKRPTGIEFVEDWPVEILLNHVF